MNPVKLLLDRASVLDAGPASAEIIEAVHRIDAYLCRSGMSDDQDGRRAHRFWSDFLDTGNAVYYISDGGYSRLCLSIWESEDGSPILGLDRGLSTPFSLERWVQLVAGVNA